MPSTDERDVASGSGAISEHYREIVTLLFGIVFAQSLPNYLDFITLGPPRAISVLVLPTIALLSSHVAIILSWLGYHHQLVAYEYTPDRWGLFQMFIDVIIVVGYFGLINLASRIRAMPGETVNWGVIYLVAAYVVIHLLYIMNDWILRQAHQADSEARIGYVLLNARFFVYFVILELVYLTLDLFLINTRIHEQLLAAVVLVVTGGLVLRYRYLIFQSSDPDSIGQPA